MHARALHSFFASAITASLAACGGSEATSKAAPPAVDGSAGIADAGSSADGGFVLDPIECMSLPSPSLLGSVDAGAFDYLEARGRTVESFGVKCAHAANPAACAAAFDAIQPPTGYPSLVPGGCGGGSGETVTYYAFTHGDQVGRISDASELVAAFGTIDTEAKALMVVSASGRTPTCTSNSPVRRTADGFEVEAFLWTPAVSQYIVSVVLVRPDGTVTVVRDVGPTPRCDSVGRRPAGLVAAHRRRGRSIVGEYFADIARLEAASVDAFRILGTELRAHGAPRRLVREAARAARDEVRHARMTAALARRFDAKVEAPTVIRGPVRSLRDFAIENAVEGCVRETFGALTATWQATAATDPKVRSAMRIIARDETRHGALAWRVASWLDGRLGPADRRSVADARHAEIAALVASTKEDAAPELVHVAGLPTAARAHLFTSALERTIWSS